jgi:RHS repeat-associated protein
VVWEIPIEVPPGRNGQTPALTLRYHSGIVDELRGTQNPQSSWAGLGWNLDLGYIARKIELDPNYVPRCTEEYHLVLNGVSSKLIPIGNNEYRTEDERYWRVQRLTTTTNRGGDYWLVTTADGTQYRLGYQDETAGGDSRESAWWMVTTGCDGSPQFRYTNWRWNVDQIADTYGNIVRVDYRRETNDFVFLWEGHAHIYSTGRWCNGAYECWCQVYGQTFYCHDYMAGQAHPSGYVRGGSLEQITYSWPNATHKVIFQVGDRSDYPTAFDSQRQTQLVQTFWSKERLQSIEVRSAGQGQVVRRYELSGGYDEDGRLRLQGVQEVAADGTRLPQMTFGYLQLPGYSGNCVPGQSEGGWKPWLGSVSTGYGGSIGFNYIAPLGMPWFQNGQTMGPNEGGKCWYRYRVREVTVNPGVGAVMRTAYEYRTAGDNAPHNGSWSGDEFRGHPRVRVLQRDESGAVVAYSDHFFHQGLGQSTATGICGENVADADGLQGREYKRVDYDGVGNAMAVQTTRWQMRDLGGGRRFVAPVAVCESPNGGNGPYRRTDYAYDDYGNVTRIAQYGDATRPGDEATVERVYVTNTGRWIVDRVATESLLDANGRVARQTRTAYDGQAWGIAPITGSATAVMRGLDGWGWVTTTMQYDAWGNAVATTDPLGRVTRTDYDPVYHQYPISTTNPLTQTTRMEWDLRLSVPTVITDANGAATRLGYDPFGRLITVTYPGESAPAVRYAYPTGASISAPWAITTEVRVDPYSATPTYGRSWTFYDGLGRPIQTQTQAENGWLVVQDTAYDALGRPVTVTLPYTVTATGGVYRTPNWTALPKTVTQYDALGRVVQVTAPDGSVTRRAYRDWREMVLDAEGHQTEYEKDGLGRLIAVREYYGTYITPTWNPGETPAETRYWYDAADNLIGVRDGLGNVTCIAYDPLGRKTAMDDPSMGHWEYRYDAAGNLVKQRDARHQAICFAYDPLNRLVGKTYHANVAQLDGLVCPGPPYAVAYGYDQGPNGIGRRTAMTDTTGVTTWRYDARGRVLTETRTLTSIGTFTTGWGYDAAGRVVRQVYPDGEVVTTAYNLRGLPTAVVGQSPYLAGATYNALGRPLQQTWGNDRVTTYAYHPQNARLTQLTVPGNLLDLRYGYDRVGNITAITDTVNGGQVQTFGYDARDRLVWARTSAAGNGQYSETYGYDRMGNILTRTVGSQASAYTYGCPPVIPPPGLPPTLPHRVWFPLVMKGYGPDSSPPPACVAPFAVVSTSVGFRAAYDPNGNMVRRVENGVVYTQTFDAENRLVAVTTPTGTVQFRYDGDGNRVLRIGPEGATVYIGDYYEKRGSVVTKYYDAAGQRIAVRVGGSLYFLHGDHLGSATLTTDGGGNWVGEARYTPYGEMRRDYPRGVIPTDRLYTGQRQETFGLYDYGARYYSPGLGRFVSADIVVVAPDKPQNLNRYAYVYNSPLRYIDPTGLIAQQEAERAQEIIALLQREYWLFVRTDFGWRFLPVMHPAPGEPTAHVIWEEGMWQLAELELLFEAVSDLASAMGGAEHFRENLRGVWVERAVMRYAGLGAAHRIVLNAGGFTKWTVVHELAHAWDAVRGWRLSKEMQEAMGAGFAHPIRHFFNPGNPAWWYDPGQGPPPCGIDANFNEKEDFAEAVTAYVYPDRASQWAAERGWPYTDPGRGYAYASFLETPRGQFIAALLTDHNRR